MRKFDTDRQIVKLLPLVQKMASRHAERIRDGRLDAAELFAVGSAALVEAARRWKMCPPDEYEDEASVAEHFCAYCLPRVDGAMVDARRRWFRTKLRNPPQTEEWTDSAGACGPDEQHEAEAIELVQAIYNRFGEDAVELVADVVFREKSQTEIAAQRGISQSAVSIQWQAISAKLRNWMNKDNENSQE